jgi:DNA-binding NarL/FixJ family response regulator
MFESNRCVRLPDIRLQMILSAGRFGAGNTDEAMRTQQQHIAAFAGFSLFLLVQISGFHSTMDLAGISGIGEKERAWYMLAIITAHVVVYFVAAFIWRRREAEPLARPRLLAVVTTTVGLAGFALLRVPVSLCLVSGAVLIGSAMALCSLYWLQRLRLFGYRGSYLYLLGGHAAATCLCALILLIPSHWGSVIVPLCFVLSNLCLARTTSDFSSSVMAVSPASPASEAIALSPSSALNSLPPLTSLAAQARSTALLLWRGILSVCIFALLSGLVSRISGQTTTDPVFFQSFMLAASCFVLIIMFIPAILTNKPLKLENSYFIALPLSALSFLIVPSLISPLPAGVSGILVTTGYMLVGIVLYCTIAEISRFANIPASPLFAACEALTLACYLLGILLAHPVSRYIPGDFTGILIIGFGLFYLVVLGAVSLLSRPVLSLHDRLTPVDTRGDEGADPRFTSVSVLPGTSASADTSVAVDSKEAAQRLLLDRLAHEFDLSEREHEILLLLARGRTLSRIGEDFYLSTSAIKYHTHSIYRKLGVHSRRELLLMLLSDGSASSASDDDDHVVGRGELTAREQQVLELLVRGWPVSSIAESLGVSQNTTRSHIKRVYQRLGVHSRQELLDLSDGRDRRSSLEP